MEFKYSVQIDAHVHLIQNKTKAPQFYARQLVPTIDDPDYQVDM